jgi:glutathione-specific gamma-glutamylcyclotransferase
VTLHCPLHPANLKNPAHSLEAIVAQWGGKTDLWIFGYASLIWRPEFAFAEQRFATARGYHRALKMWSTYNRGSPQCPGLVFGLLPGGSCKGMVFRIPRAKVAAALVPLWEREMPNAVYDPKWLRCQTMHNGEKTAVTALAFTLSKTSPDHTGELPHATYLKIFAEASGRYGTTRDYAQQTYDGLRKVGIHDRALGELLKRLNSSQ